VTNARPRRLVLIGHPVAHSLSPLFQNAALRAAGHSLTYEALDVQADILPDVMQRLVSEQAAGNVTIPHKEAVWKMCTHRTPLADRAQAVNTFWVEHNDLFGDNTDVGGFDHLVRSVLGDIPARAKIALIGAGGSAAAVLTAIEQWQGASVAVVGRTSDRAAQLVARFSDVARNEMMLDRALGDATLVVNATPIGLDGAAHPVDLELVPSTATIVDLVYRPGGTSWVRHARTLGIRATDGLPMLIEQGALAFERWLGFAPDRTVMWEAVSHLL
jgi:shikimate dehydrogenase